MSLYGALFSGVSGLSAQSAAMGAISDNISNVNTVGYKDTTVNFDTLVTHQVSLTDYSPGGVQSKPRANIDSQGLLQSTSSSTDVAISGSGFFVVNSVADPLQTGSGEFAYSRAGSFKVDQNGYLQNTAGWYLQGWPLTAWDGTATASHQTINGSNYMAAYKNSTGSYTYINTGVVDPTNLQPLNLNDIAGTAQATTSVRMGANLPAGASVGYTGQTNIQEYDSLGNSHNVLMNWTKTAQNQWSASATPPEGASMLTLYDTSASQNIYSNAGRLDFTQVPTSGALKMTINGTDYTFNVGTGTSGATANTFYANPTGVTSDSVFATTMASQIQTAFEMQYNSTSGTVAPSSGTYSTSLAAGTNLSITYQGQTYSVSLTGYNPQNPGTSGTSGTLNYALAQAGLPSTISFSYAGGQLTLNNGTTSSVTVSGSGDLEDLTTAQPATVAAGGSISTSAGALELMEASDTGTLTIGGTAVTVGATPAVTAANINAAAISGITATYDAATNTMSIANSTASGVTITGTGNYAAADLTGVVGGNIPAGGTVTDSAYSNNPELTVGTGTPISVNGMTMAGAIAAINAQSATTGISAQYNGGQVVLYTGNNATYKLTATGDLSAAFNATQVVGNGLSYCSEVAGTGGIVINQYDNNSNTGNIVISGITSLKNNNTDVLEQAINPNSTNPDTFTLQHLSSVVYSGTQSVTNDPLHGAGAPAITFNGNGTPATINVGGMKIAWTNGSQNQDQASSLTDSPPISLFLGDTNQSDGMTQLSSSQTDISLTYMDQNGAKFGNFSGLSIGSNGIVTAQFDNGVTVPIFQIPIATFVDPDGLQSLSGNVYVASDFSGLPTLRTPGEAGSGQLNESSLEASTVDIGTEFTDMIVTQRAYSASAKIITTANQMLDDLLTIVR